MAQPAEIYVDPSIAADSGAGTVGDPYGDLEYAIEQTTFDTTDGTRVNIKAGTDEILAAVLQDALNDTVTTVAWAPAEVAPCVLQGYTATAGDGGVGGISGSGSIGIFTGAAFDYIHLIDLHMHNCGSSAVIDLDNFCSVIRCEVDNTSGAGVQLDDEGVVSECYIHNIGNVGAEASAGTLIQHNYFENGTNVFTRAINLPLPGFVYRNIIDIDGASDGIIINTGAKILHNSIYSNAGTGQGIVGVTGRVALCITNNIVEGFSGSGGIGFDLDVSNFGVLIYGGNAAFNNATNYTAPAAFTLDDLGDNETLLASGFKDAANRDFSPINTGSVKEGALPADFGNGQ